MSTQAANSQIEAEVCIFEAQSFIAVLYWVLRHRVHKLTFFIWPLISIVAFWIIVLQVLRVRRLEWLTLLPVRTWVLQSGASHVAIFRLLTLSLT